MGVWFWTKPIKLQLRRLLPVGPRDDLKEAPNPTRPRMLSPADASFETRLRNQLPDTVFRDPAAYQAEPRGRWRGQGLVVAPSNTAEVVAVVRACAQAGVGIVPYSGGTGLVGGQVKPDGPAPVILALDRMTQVRDIYPSESVIVVDAGVILADLQQAADDVGRMFPMSLASEGSARVGGLLATNAGGVNVLRYGNMRAQCLGLEVVLANGTIWNGLSRLRKDNTGYDLRDLMIGSEGTLGIITAASLRLVPKPQVTSAALLAVRDPAAALELLALAGDIVGEGLSAFELIGKQGFEFLAEVGPDTKTPFDTPPDWSVLIDVGLAAGGEAQAVLMDLFEAGMAADLVSDGVLAQSEADRTALWTLRESIPEANRRIGSISSHDISLPLSVIPDFITQGQAALARIGDFRINCFGHLGDGNLHYNVFPAQGRDRSDYLEKRDTIKTCIHGLTHSFGGSISAEHGIGRLKVDDLTRYSDPVKLAVMRSIKDALDPKGIMNPGAILSPSS